MLSDTPKKLVIAEVTEVDREQAFILVAISREEFFNCIVPLNFCPKGAQTIGSIFKISWEFIFNLDRSDGRVVSHALSDEEINSSELAEGMYLLRDLKLRLNPFWEG